MKIRKWVLAVLVSTVLPIAIFVLGGRAAAPPEEVKKGTPIKIGIVAPLDTFNGRQQGWAGQMAADDINRAGGVRVGKVNRPIEVIEADSNELRSIPDAVLATEKLYSANMVDATFGWIRSEAALACMDVAARKKKLMFGCNPAHYELCNRVRDNYSKYKYYFDNTLWDDEYAVNASGIVEILQKAVQKELGIQEVRIALVAEKNMWADGLLKAWEPFIIRLGMKKVGAWRPSPLASDLTAELTAVKALRPHVIGFIGSVSPIPISKGWTDLKFPALLFAHTCNASKEHSWIPSKGTVNYASGQGFMPVPITPNSIPFWNNFRDRYKQDPGHLAVMLYEQVYAFKEAVEKAATVDSDALVPDLEKVKFLGVLGPFAYNEIHHRWFNRRGGGLVICMQWVNGKPNLIWPKMWEGQTLPTADYVLPPWVVEYWKTHPEYWKAD